MAQQRTGISNRETPTDEARERESHPPVRPESPPPQDAAGRVGEQPLSDMRNRHTSHKGGSRSIAQKEAASKYADRATPGSHAVSGAFGREPRDSRHTTEDRTPADETHTDSRSE